MPGPAFAALAAAIDPRVSADAAATLLANYRAEVRREAAGEVRVEAQPGSAMYRAWLDVADFIDPTPSA